MSPDATNVRPHHALRHPQGPLEPPRSAISSTIPMEMLPEVRDCAAEFGVTRADLFRTGDPDPRGCGRSAGGHARAGLLHPRHAEIGPYGTGCFRRPQHRRCARRPRRTSFWTTISYQLDGRPTYALEGSIFIAGAVVQWLRRRAEVDPRRAETQALAEAADPGPGPRAGTCLRRPRTRPTWKRGTGAVLRPCTRQFRARRKFARGAQLRIRGLPRPETLFGRRCRRTEPGRATATR